MFGNNSFGNTSFGSSIFGGGFGAAPTLGTFGSANQTNTQTQGPVGTTIRFIPLNGTDSVQKTGSNTGPTQITTRHQNISAMKEYESKSVDELRLEDYAANRKVGPPQPAFNASPFSSIQPSTSQQNTSIFSTNTQQAPNLFGTPNQNQTTNLFGQAKTGFEVNSPSNIFNSSLNKPNTAVSSSPFNIGTPFNTGTSTASATPGFSLFNSNTQTNASPFGAASTSSPFKSNMFTTPASNSGSVFSTNTNPTTSGFLGQNQTTNAAQPQTTFNASPFSSIQPSTSQQNTSIFSTNTQQAPNLFGTPNQNQTTNLFGQAKTGFEVNSPSNIFNSSLNKPNTAVSSSPFNIGTPFNTGTSTASATPGFSLFNSNTQTNASPFGAASTSSPFKSNMFTTPASNSGSVFSTNTNPTTSGFLGQNQTTNAAQPQTTFNASPFSSIQPSTSQQNTSIFSTNTQQAPNLFGNPNQNQTTNIFGQAKTGFEVNSPSNIFNSSLNKPNTAVSSSPFNIGAPFNTGTSTANPTPGFSLFNNTQVNNTSLFNAVSTSSPFKTNSIFNTPASNSGSLFNTNTNPITTGFLGQNQTATVAPTQAGLSSFSFGSIQPNTNSALIQFIESPPDLKALNQFRMKAKTTVQLNKPASTEKPRVSSVLFDGLDDNTNNDLRCAIDIFAPKKNIKKLELKPTSGLSDGDTDQTRDSPQSVTN